MDKRFSIDFILIKKIDVSGRKNRGFEIMILDLEYLFYIQKNRTRKSASSAFY